MAILYYNTFLLKSGIYLKKKRINQYYWLKKINSFITKIVGNITEGKIRTEPCPWCFTIRHFNMNNATLIVCKLHKTATPLTLWHQRQNGNGLCEDVGCSGTTLGVNLWLSGTGSARTLKYTQIKKIEPRFPKHSGNHSSIGSQLLLNNGSLYLGKVSVLVFPQTRALKKDYDRQLKTSVNSSIRFSQMLVLD